MDQYNEKLTALSHDPEYRRASTEIQRSQYLDVLEEELLKSNTFLQSTPEAKKLILQDFVTSDFRPTYASDGFKSFLDQTKQAYLAGDPNAREAMIQYSGKTDFGERLPIFSAMARAFQNPEKFAERKAVPGGYAQSPLRFNRSYGADDNRARVEISELFQSTGDTDGIKRIDQETHKGAALAINVAEEIATALIVNAAIGTPAKATVKVGEWFSRHSPGLIAEATAEGIRGAADYANRRVMEGNDPSVAGAMRAFGIHAAIDVAISHMATALITRIPRDARKFAQAQEFLETRNRGIRIASGEAIEVPPMLSAPHARHEAARLLYNDTNAKFLKNPASLDTAEPFVKANYDGYEAGYMVTKSEDGTLLAQRQGKPNTKPRVFKSISDYNDWVGKKQFDMVETYVAQGRIDEASAYMARHPGFQYGLFREQGQRGFDVTNTPKKFTPARMRQHINDLEARDMASTNGLNPVRFQKEVSEKALDNGSIVFPTNTTIDIIPKADGNAIVQVSNAASRQDWDAALKEAQSYIAAHKLDDVAELVARDNLIKAGYDSVDMGDSSLRLLMPDNAKVINNKVNPTTGKISEEIYEAPAKKSTGQAAEAQKSLATKEAKEAIAETQSPGKVAQVEMAEGVQKANKASQVRKGSNPADAFNSDTSKKLWLDYVASKTDRIAVPLRQGADGWEIGIKIPAGGVLKRSYRNIDDAFRDIIAIEKIPHEVGLDLADNGFELFQMNKKQFPFREWKILAKDGDELARFNDTELYKVYEELGLEPTMPARLQPTHSIISDIPDTNLIATKEIALGNKESAFMFQGKFRDTQAEKVNKVIVKKPDGRKIVKVRKNNYQADIPELNHTEMLDSSREAQQYLNKTWMDSEHLQNAAMDKGVSMTFSGGKWKVFHQDHVFNADTKKALIRELSQVSTPKAAKEVMPDDLLKELDRLGFELELPPGFTKASRDLSDVMSKLETKDLASSKPTLWNQWLPKKQAVRRMIRGVDPKGELGLGEAFEAMLKDMDFARNKSWQDQQALADIFKGYSTNIEKRKGIFHYLEAEGDFGKKAAQREWGLANSDVDVANRLKAFYETKSGELGIPFNKIIKEYQPHLRNWAHKNGSKGIEGQDIDKMLKKDPMLNKYFKDNPYVARAQMERSLDGMRDWMDEDSLHVAVKYSSAENRAFYANDATSNYFQLLKKNFKQLSTEDNGLLMASIKLRESFENPGALYQMDALQKTLNKTLGKVVKEEHLQGLPQMLLSMPGLVNMTARAWLPLRNMFQTLTVGPLRTGSLAVQGRAIAKVRTRKMLRDTVAEMMDRGIVPRKGAMTTEYLELLEGTADHMLPKYYELMRRGMKLYSASDDWTRAVMYQASNEVFDKGLKKASRTGALDIDKMVHYTMTDTLDPAQTATFRKFLTDDNLPGAKDLLAKYNIEFTMFDYGTINKPMAASSGFGQIFYQMGTFSINYLQSVMTTARNGALGNRVKAFLAMGAGSLAVSQLAKEAGIYNSSFLPWKMAAFTGGPWIDIGKDISSVTAPGMEGAMARRNLSKTFSPVSAKDGKLMLQYPSIFPGGLHARYLKKGVTAWEEGDVWGVAKALGTVPSYKE